MDVFAAALCHSPLEHFVQRIHGTVLVFEVNVGNPKIHLLFFFSEVDGAQGALSDGSGSSDVGLKHVEGHVSKRVDEGERVCS